MSQPNPDPPFLPELLLDSDDEGGPTFSLENIRRIAIVDEPHKHVSFGPYEDENDDPWKNQHDGSCFLVLKLNIVNGASYGIVKMLKYISSNVNDFYPISPSILRKNIIFSVMNVEQAEEIKALCELLFNQAKITVIISRKYYSVKNIPSDEALKRVMVRRFNESNNALDLSNVKNERGFPQNLLTSLPGILSLVKIIKKKYPHACSIILKENSLDNMKLLTSLVFICKNLKTLDISQNKLTSIAELEVLQLCPKIENLILRHNPFSLECLGLEAYGRKVHCYLPKIKTLDNADVSTKEFYQNGILPSTSALNTTTNASTEPKPPVDVVTID